MFYFVVQVIMLVFIIFIIVLLQPFLLTVLELSEFFLECDDMVMKKKFIDHQKLTVFSVVCVLTIRQNWAWYMDDGWTFTEWWITICSVNDIPSISYFWYGWSQMLLTQFCGLTEVKVIPVGSFTNINFLLLGVGWITLSVEMLFLLSSLLSTFLFSQQYLFCIS